MVDQMAAMLASLIRTDSQTADYWALHLQMETQTGWKMADQRYLGSQMEQSLVKQIHSEA